MKSRVSQQRGDPGIRPAQLFYGQGSIVSPSSLTLINFTFNNSQIAQKFQSSNSLQGEKKLFNFL